MSDLSEEKDIRANREALRELMVRMMTVRQFEETAYWLFGQGLVHGTMHLSVGEEAASIGTTAALKDGDYMLATHRGHGQALGKGVGLNAMMAELLGRETGTNHGKGGSMHICDFDHGILGANGIVGANGPIACGAALTIQMKHIPDRICAVFFGDGASNQGAMMESLNLAAVWDLPVLFVLTENQYGMSTRLDRAVRETDLTKRADAFGIPSLECDGNDVLAVFDTVREARRYILEEKGPFLVEEHTYRISGHSKSDGNLYRSREEIRYWKEHGPILRFGTYLFENGIFTKEEIKEMEAGAETAVAEAVAYAKEQPCPSARDLEKDVYA